MVKKDFPEAVDKSNNKEGWHQIVTQRLLSSYGNKEYYFGISQSTVYGSYHITLLRHDVKEESPKVTFSQLTIPAARTLLLRLPEALLSADKLQESCFITERKTIPLDNKTTDMV